MANVPPFDIQQAFVAPTATIRRRIEIYEQDTKTPWRQDLWDDLLVGGTVSIDYSRDERRNLDVELDNYKGDLDPKTGGLWYDKVFKVFYGITLNQKPRKVWVAIVEESNAPGQALALKKLLADSGVTQVSYLPLTVSYDQIKQYDVIVSIADVTSVKMGLLNDAFAHGKSVITFSAGSTAAQLPLVIGNADVNPVVSGSERIAAGAGVVSAVATGWGEWRWSTGQAYRKILAPATGAKTLVLATDDNGQAIAAILREQLGVAKWGHVNNFRFRPEDFSAGRDQFGLFAARLMNWASNYVPQEYWETQIGEFLADAISSSDAFDTVKVVGRDFTKRCITSKFATATTFAKTEIIEEVIKSVAANAGITKFDLPITRKTLDREMTWERGTSRWDVVKEIAKANNYELYFTAEGYLTMREFRDPLLTAPTLILLTGFGGNLVSRGAKTSDSRLFNHIIVVGESSDSSVPPVYAEAINDNVGSSSSRNEIGDRVDITTSSLITDVSQAQQLATSLLSVAALEEFELDFSAVLLPWIEPGDIVEMGEGDNRYWGPDRFLLTSLSLPLDLNPMSGNGKRVLKVA